MENNNERHFWNSEIEVGLFLASLIAMTGAKQVLEVGVFQGETSKDLINALPKGGLFHGVDIEDHRSEDAIKVFKTKGKKIDFTVGDSKEVLKDFENDHYDLIFVDSEHHWDHILPEFKLVENLVAPGGMIVYHDSIHLPDVAELMKYAKHYGYDVTTLNTPEGRGLSILKRK